MRLRSFPSQQQRSNIRIGVFMKPPFPQFCYIKITLKDEILKVCRNFYLNLELFHTKLSSVLYLWQVF